MRLKFVCKQVKSKISNKIYSSILSKDIVFIVSEFPLVSQTFVVSNVVEAIKEGYDIQVLASRLHNASASSQEKLLLLTMY